MKTLILGNFTDMQTAHYIMNAFYSVSSDVWGIDTRGIVEEKGLVNGQQVILDELKDVEFTPELILILKGLEISPLTLSKIKEKYPSAIFVNWFFDKYLSDKPIWENIQYHDTIRFYDYYFCSLKGVVNKLNDLGFENVYFLPEACDEDLNGETLINHYQEQKYGEDISFVGTLGLSAHTQRIKILEKIVKEGFNIKVWGKVACEWKYLSPELKDKCMNQEVVNESHSRVAQSSLINLGIDQDVSLELGQSARMYRVLCAGGLYLTTYVKGLESMFNINKDGKAITGEEDLVVYYSQEDLINKLDFLLENEDVRKKIAKNGQKTVLEKHTFKDRIKDMIKITRVNKNERNTVFDYELPSM